jgi:hypothetical protein
MFKLVLNVTNAQWTSLSDRAPFNFSYTKVTFFIGSLMLYVLRLNSWNLEGFLVGEFRVWVHTAAEFLEYPSDVQALAEEYVLRCYTFYNFPFDNLIGFGSVFHIDYFEVRYWLVTFHRGEVFWGKRLCHVTSIFSLHLLIYYSQLTLWRLTIHIWDVPHR